MLFLLKSIFVFCLIILLYVLFDYIEYIIKLTKIKKINNTILELTKSFKDIETNVSKYQDFVRFKLLEYFKSNIEIKNIDVKNDTIDIQYRIVSIDETSNIEIQLCKVV